MKLNKYLILSKLQTNTANDDSDIILLDNIHTIPDCSADIITCIGLDYRPHEKINITIQEILAKLKPQGKLIITLINYKKICNEFLFNKIKSSVLFEYLQNKQSTPTIDDIITNLNANNTKLININHQDYKDSIVIERTSI